MSHTTNDTKLVPPFAWYKKNKYTHSREGGLSNKRPLMSPTISNISNHAWCMMHASIFHCMGHGCHVLDKNPGLPHRNHKYWLVRFVFWFWFFDWVHNTLHVICHKFAAKLDVTSTTNFPIPTTPPKPNFPSCFFFFFINKYLLIFYIILLITYQTQE